MAMIDNGAIVVATSADLLALTLAVGAAACELWMLPASHAIDAGDASARLCIRLRRLFGLGLLGLAVSSVAGLLLQTASFSEQSLWQAVPLTGTVLTQTHYGQVWLLRAGAIAAGALIWFLYRQRPDARKPLYLALAALLVSIYALSSAGHAGDDGAFTPMNLANTLHIFGGLLWGGGIAAFMLVLLPALRWSQPPTRPLIAMAVLGLSRVSALALALVIGSGLYNAWLQVGALGNLWTTLYGQILMFKVELVVVMMALGAWHRYVAVPALQRWAGLAAPRFLLPLQRYLPQGNDEDAAGTFRRTLRVEAILLVAVLALAAALSQQTPAAHMEASAERTPG